jgi:hypothetical protein
MEEALRFFQTIEKWVYLILGLVAFFFIRKFILSWQELRDAAFGLERENAQGKLNFAAIVLVVLLAMAISEFVLVSFVAPAVPGVEPLPSPTLDLLASPTITLAALTPEITPTGTLEGTIQPTQPGQQGGCIPGQIEITSPVNGSEIGGVVEIRGTANIPNFGFYKLEMKRVEETNWLTILAGNTVTTDATLGSWNTSLLSPGDHQLSLVLTDNQGQILPACIVQVRITVLSVTPQP